MRPPFFQSEKFRKIVLAIAIYSVVSFNIAGLLTGLSIWSVSTHHYQITQFTSLIARNLLAPFRLVFPFQIAPDLHIWTASLYLLQQSPNLISNVEQVHNDFLQSSTLSEPTHTTVVHTLDTVQPEVNRLQTLLPRSFIGKLFFPEQLTTLQQTVSAANNFIPVLQIFLQNFDEITAKDGVKNYLIVLQNDRELRPTGGFLGSYALVRFNDGKLVNFDVQDIYVPDGQLPERVPPPQPIQEAFQQGFWRLRDANWHPDASVSADRIAWFFASATEKKIDGVIFVTYHAIEQLIKHTEPLYLPDYNQSIDADQLYPFLQTEVEEDFFPGSTKKKDVLASAANQFFHQIQNQPLTKKLQLMKVVDELLTEKYILIDVQNDELQNHFSTLKWSGELRQDDCKTQNCFSDYLSIFDANLGVNKANCCVNRDVQVEKKFDQQTSSIQSTVTITYTLDNSPDEITAEYYKAFGRMYAPSLTTLQSITVNGSDYEQFIQQSINNGFLFSQTRHVPTTDVVNGLTEFGYWIYAQKHTPLVVTLTFSTAVPQFSNYQLQLQKQPGTRESYNHWQVIVNQESILDEILKSDTVMY